MLKILFTVIVLVNSHSKAGMYLSKFINIEKIKYFLCKKFILKYKTLVLRNLSSKQKNLF
jgi:hypothetical protein